MRLNLDLHVHSNFSADAIGDPRKLIECARSKKIDGFALTDHNSCEGIKSLINAGLMREDGGSVDGILIIPGVEISTQHGHLLCLGTLLPNLRGESAMSVCRIIHERGGLAVAPHPFDRFRAGIREHVLDQLPLDAIEVFNAATLLPGFNAKALHYAKRRSLSFTCGSDAHTVGALGTSVTSVEAQERTVGSVLASIRLGMTETSGQYLSIRQVATKTVCNMKRLRRLVSSR